MQVQWSLISLIVTCFQLLTRPPRRLISFCSPWAVRCMALLKRLSLPCVVLISNKRGCKTQGGRPSWQCHSALFPSVSSAFLFQSSPLRRITWPALHPSCIHPSFFLGFSIHPAVLACTVAPMLTLATPVFFCFFSDTHGCPVDFDPQILVSGDHSLARLGEVTEMSVFSFCAHEKEREREAGERARDSISGE